MVFFHILNSVRLRTLTNCRMKSRALRSLIDHADRTKPLANRSVINNSRSSSRFPAATECYTQLVVFKFYDSELVHIVYIRF